MREEGRAKLTKPRQAAAHTGREEEDSRRRTGGAGSCEEIAGGEGAPHPPQHGLQAVLFLACGSGRGRGEAVLPQWDKVSGDGRVGR